MFTSWDEFFNYEKKKPYFQELESFLNNEYSNKVIYPPREKMFNAFLLCPLNAVKVVIVGQDPYHEEGQAMGLSFSVPSNIKVPPSLINIYKEIENNFHETFTNKDGDLTYLANQGVLLINSILTVEEGKPLSHNIKQYKQFFKNTMLLLDSLDQPIVFILWGGNARKCKEYLVNKNHLVLEANHPSPLSANKGGFFGCNHFLLTNEYLIKNGLNPIKWIK